MQSIQRPSAMVGSLVSLLLFLGCGRSDHEADQAAFRNVPAEREHDQKRDGGSVASYTDVADDELERLLDAAEERATVDGRSVLTTGRSMIAQKEIVLGSCWDYIDAVYGRAGFPSKERSTIFRSKKRGPYADLGQVEPGDWLYYVNHSFGGIEHSAIFVGWVDREAEEALMLSYAGGSRRAPARYRTYDLSGVYTIIRPREASL